MVNVINKYNIAHDPFLLFALRLLLGKRAVGLHRQGRAKVSIGVNRCGVGHLTLMSPCCCTKIWMSFVISL